jgi:protein gp37
MGTQTNIAWADETWNPFTFNCVKVSPGCKNCYAETLTERFQGGIFKGAPVWKGEAAWNSFKKIKSGSVVFAPSMTDAFHEGLPFKVIHHFFMMMESRPDVQFLVLTKRIERAWYMRDLLPWPKNVWLGASVEARMYLYRLEYLLDIPAAGHFTSVEPLLESIVEERVFPAPLAGLERYLVHTDIQSEDLYPLQPRVIRWRDRALKWVIVGGESGVNRRPFDKQWAREIRDLCNYYQVPFMFKQGSAAKSGQDTLLDGREWMQIPEFELSTLSATHGTTRDKGSIQMSLFT